MSIIYHRDLIQGSDEWHATRCGMLTASEMKLIMTPTGKTASNDKARAHLYELIAQRVTRYVEPAYISDDMLRGQTDEVNARGIYAREIAPVEEVGFITNDAWGFTIGYSPDGLVGDDGLIECKSRRQKYQVETILGDSVPEEFMLQIQTGLLVSERKWCDFISYHGGLPMRMIRVTADADMQAKIVEAATRFEEKAAELLAEYQRRLNTNPRLIPTERTIEQEMHL